MDKTPIAPYFAEARIIYSSYNEGETMKYITQNGEAKLVATGVGSDEEQEQTFVMLKILALGKLEIEQGHYRPANEVFTEMNLEDEQ
jgi:hypothetical protein